MESLKYVENYMQTKQDMLEAAVQVGEFLDGGKIGTIIFSQLITEY